MLIRKAIIFFLLLFLHNTIFAQTWHWAKRDLIIDGIHTNPVKSLIDNKGNTILLSLKLDRQIVSKHDENGILIWKRELFLVTPGSNHLTDFCIDSFDNIYLAIAPISRIDTITINTPSPYSLIKLNSLGRFLWARKIDYAPLIFAPQLKCNSNRIFLALSIQQFLSLTYQGVTYNNLGGNTKCSFITALDTSGNVQWFKRMYSPPQPISCNVRDVYPAMSINEGNDLALVGVATDKIMVETVPVIDYPYLCKHFNYGMVLNGNTGQIKWVKELPLDTITPKPNKTILLRRTLSAILTNGNIVVYRCITQDSAITSTISQMTEISNKIYLFNNTGVLARKDTIGRLENGWHEMYQMVAGDESKFFSSGIYSGPYDGIKVYEARKWDTLFTRVWKKNTEFIHLVPYFASNHLSYRNRALNLILQSGSQSSNLNYAYFGVDSLLPYLDNLYARMLDSTNYIAGTVFFDNNQNGIKDPTEFPAPNVLISNNAGDTVYDVTNSNGYFEIKAEHGSYVIRPLNLASSYPNYTTVSPSNYPVSVSGYGNYLRNKNFALRPSSVVTDGQINIILRARGRPGGALWYDLSVKNVGGNLINGTYKVKFDTSRITYVNSLVPPATVLPPELIFNVSNLLPLQEIKNQVRFTIKTNVTIGDTIKTKAEMTVSPADALLINNADSSYAYIFGSFDPNDKEVYPFKDVKYDSVIAGKQRLDYIIHFQNTGNDTAFSVHIMDTLDSKLDLSTFNILGSSHPVMVNLLSARVIDFHFPGIQLPDSNINRPGSQGYVRFSLKPKTNVLLSDIVKNNASIFFDYNLAVKTNTVATTFATSVVTSVSNNSIAAKGIRIRPNPINDELYFKVIIGNLDENMALSVFDESGRLMLSTTRKIISNSEQQIDLLRLSPGVYYLQLKNQKNYFIKKFVKQ